MLLQKLRVKPHLILNNLYNNEIINKINNKRKNIFNKNMNNLTLEVLEAYAKVLTENQAHKLYES